MVTSSLQSQSTLPFFLSSSYLSEVVVYPPNPVQFVADIRAEFDPQIMLWFTSAISILVVSWLLRTWASSR
jgi:hypothetical protein